MCCYVFCNSQPGWVDERFEWHCGNRNSMQCVVIYLLRMAQGYISYVYNEK